MSIIIASTAMLCTSAPWELLGFSKATWSRLRAAGKTPPPIHLSRGRPSWRISDLQKWLAEQPARERPTNRGGDRRRQAEDAEASD